MLKSMVVTRLRAKVTADNVEEPQVTSESSMTPETIFMNKILDHMDETTLKISALEVENVELRDNFMNQEEDHENLKVRYEYSEW